MEPTSFKIRPFDRVFDVAGENPFRASAVIEGDGILISIVGSGHRLKTVGRGADKWGEFAFIEPGEWPLPLGFVLTVEPEFSEDEPPGCRVSLTRAHERELRDEIDATLVSQGVDPRSVNILAPPSASVSIYFNESGSVAGYATVSFSPARHNRTTH